MIHTNGLKVQNKFHKINAEQYDSRGLVCLVFKELYDSLKSVLSQEEIEMIFTKEELNYYLPLQFEILNQTFVKKLQNIDVNYNDDIPFNLILDQYRHKH